MKMKRESVRGQGRTEASREDEEVLVRGRCLPLIKSEYYYEAHMIL